MEPTSSPAPMAPPPPSGRSPVPALAIASLVLGVVGLVLSVFVIGSILPIIGLILGALHLRRHEMGRGIAWSGIWTSIAALVAAAGFAAFFVSSAREFTRSMSPRVGGGFEAWHGKPAPDIEFKTLDHGTLRLADLKGRRVVLDFWATWCGPCVMEIPHFIQLQREASTNDLMIVGISNEDRDVLSRFVASKRINYPIGLSPGGGLPEPYSEITGIPTTFFIDRQGVIEHVAVGYHDLETLRRRALGSEVGRHGTETPGRE